MTPLQQADALMAQLRTLAIDNTGLAGEAYFRAYEQAVIARGHIASDSEPEETRHCGLRGADQL